MNADTIIIGSGVAGVAIATRLLHHNPKASILMFEAGNYIRMKDFALFHSYLVKNKLPEDRNGVYDSCSDLPYGDRDRPGENVSVGKTLVPLDGARLMIYGGTTVHWGGWSFRLKPEDFRLHSNTGFGIDWPISYEDLEPYYCEAEHFIGVTGDSNDKVTPRSREYPYRPFPFTLEDGLYIDAFKNLGVTYSHLPIARTGIPANSPLHAPCQTTGTCKYCPFGARFAAANYLDDIRNLEAHPNLVIMKNVIVEEIIMNSKSKVSAVRFLDKNKGEFHVASAARIILTAGAIESPKLLLRSTSKLWREGIGNDTQLVGKNFITHPYFSFKATLQSNPKRLQPQMNLPTLVSRHFDSEAEQKKGKFILINPSSSPVVNLAKAMMQGKNRDEIIAMVEGPVDVQMQGMLEIFSSANNKISNYTQRNRVGLLETVVDYSQDVTFDQRIQEIQKIVTGIFNEMAASNTMEDRPISWRADHAACTTRMSRTPEEGVVDSNLKIHGVDNLYVCSNASFASLGAVNPTLTLTALSIRLADHLIKQSDPDYDPFSNVQSDPV